MTPRSTMKPAPASATLHSLLLSSVVLLAALVFGAVGSGSVSAAPEPGAKPETKLRGLKAEYFRMSEPGARDFAEPGETTLDPRIDFPDLVRAFQAKTGRTDHTTARWTGEIEAPETGEYTFYAVGDNGFRLYIDGEPVIDHWVGDWDVEQTSAPVRVRAGQRYDFRMEMFQDTGGASMFLRWSGPGIEKQIVPQAAFSPPDGFRPRPEAPVEAVDPLIGSSGGGNTYPGAVRPFGMLSWSPTTTRGDQTDTGAANGYAYDATRVRGFSLTHVNGAGCHPGASGDVPIMPFVGDVTSSPTADTRDRIYASDFSHADELAEPGHYRVKLANGATADLAATARAGVGEFTFPRGEAANLLFRASNSLNGSEDADIKIDPEARTVSGSVLTGAFCGRRANGGENNRKTYYRLHFTAHFDRDFSSTGTWVNDELRPGTTEASGGEGYLTGDARRGRGSGGYVSFDPGRDDDVRVRIGISYTSLRGAEKNLAAETTARSTVEGVTKEGEREWDRALDSIRVAGGTPDGRTAFYTALYHSYLQPNVSSDVDGRYLGSDGEVHRLARGQEEQYGNFSGWDQYRAHTQLLALLEPRVAGDFAQSLLNLSEQNGGVWDRWVHVNGPTHVMTGDPSAPTLAGFHAMGVRNYDVGAAFDSLVRQATVPHPSGLSTAGCPGQCEGQRPNLQAYMDLGYAPQDACNCWGGAAETLEASTADFALADWARRLGRAEEREELMPRADWWRNTFNPAAAADAGAGAGYQQARNADGSWVEPFSPASDLGFAQGTSATYTWMVQHDVGGLAAAMGGKERAAERLDGFFRRPDGSWATGGDLLRYDPTNEPGIHVPWLYNALGRPWKTQETVRTMASRVYGTGPRGLPGNDDLGTMSAWYVFASLGIYPQVPSRAEMLLSSPAFERAEIQRSSGQTITVAAPGTSADNTYVQSVTLDGRPRTKSWLPESLVNKGGKVRVQVGDTPNRDWATDEEDLPVDHVPATPGTAEPADTNQ